MSTIIKTRHITSVTFMRMSNYTKVIFSRGGRDTPGAGEAVYVVNSKGRYNRLMELFFDRNYDVVIHPDVNVLSIKLWVDEGLEFHFK